jgi:hypothetical protein
MVKFFRSSTPRADQPVATRQGPAQDTGAPATREDESGRPPRTGRKPARTTLGLPALRATTSTGGPSRPAAGEAPRRAAAVSGRHMSASRNAAAQQRSRAAMTGLYPVASPQGGLPTTPDTLPGMSHEAGFRNSVQAMFGNGAEGPALANLLLGAVPPEPEGTAPFIAPLVLATALRSVGVETLDQAEALLIASTRGEHFLRTVGVGAKGEATTLIVPERRGEHYLREHEIALFRLERVLAASGPGTKALGHLRHLEGHPEQLQSLRDGLSLCTALEMKGFAMDGSASIDEVLSSLHGAPATRAKMDAPIGHNDDVPLQLLAQALRHAQHFSTGAPGKSGPHDRAAFVAWKKGGFVESGPGTEFNRTIDRLHKFTTYVDRADHGPRTLGNMARDARAWLGRTIGVGKSPLTPMRHGTQGGELGLLHQEAVKLKQSLGHALEAAVENLVDELIDPRIQQDPAERNKRLARAAVFDLWRETGQSTIALSDVVERAGRLMAEGATGPGGVREAALLPHLREFTRKSHTDDGAPALRVRMPALEAMGVARSRRGTATAPPDPQDIRQEIRQWRALPTRNAAQQERLAELQGQRRELVSALIADMRSIESAGVNKKPLFKFSDLKVLFRAAPRTGPTSADAQKVMSGIAGAKYESMSTFSDGASKGVGTFGGLLFSGGAGLGVPLVYPVLQAEAGKRAAVSIGVSNTGARLYIGTNASKSAGLGVGAGWVAPPLVNKVVSAVVLADASLSREVSHGEGAVITARNDQPGWQDKMPQVVDFLFDQARLGATDGAFPVPGDHRARDASELWSRFADQFGNDPHIAVGWNSEKSTTTGAQVGALAVARAAVGTQTSVGPAVSVGLRAQGNQFQRAPHADGADVPLAVHNRRVVVNASAAMTQTLPFVAAPGGAFSLAPVGGLEGWGSAAPWIGATMEWDVAGSLGVARLGRTREGQLSPGVCHREVLFQQPKRLVEYANLNRSNWEAAMVAQDPTGGTTPEAARSRFNVFLQQVADLPPASSALHGELRSLSPGTADQINQYEAQLTTLLGTGDRGAVARELSSAERTECNAIQNEVQRLLKDEGSWVPGGIYSVELNQTGSSSGLNFGVRAVNQEHAQTARLTALLIASVPEV